METKKTSKAALENKKGIFLQIGFITVLSMVLIAFEWTSEYEIENTLGQQVSVEIDVEKVIRTYEKEKLPPPAPVVSLDELLVIKDDVDDLEDEIDVKDNTDTDWRTIVDVIPVVDEVYDTDIPHCVVEEMPKFNGGDKDMFRKYLAENAIYPQIAYENGVQGTVLVQFCIDSKGKLVEAKVTRGVDSALDKEALRVVNSSPLWTPGKQYGKPVKVIFSFPVSFVLRNR